ncbi:hypothetical protein LIA77_07024 [Sarocladium implicatum]|nr:hypothetical protein LIA77_07024 [Sarocladium implicatum]
MSLKTRLMQQVSRQAQEVPIHPIFTGSNHNLTFVIILHHETLLLPKVVVSFLTHAQRGRLGDS